MMRSFIRHVFVLLLPTALSTPSPEQHILHAAPLCPLQPFGAWLSPDTCPINDLPPKRNTTAKAPEDGWVRGRVCRKIPDGSEIEFCTFTSRSFNNGLGMSIITTAGLFEKLSELPVFSRNAALPPAGPQTDPSPAPYRAVPVPGKGIGLVAEHPIRANEVFMTRTPAVMVDDNAFQRLGKSRLTELLLKAVDDLPRAHRRDYFNLTTHGEANSRAERAYHIFIKNNFRTPVEGVEVFHSAFTGVSRLNHACRPNSEYFFDDATLSQNVFAARDLSAGEELTVTYSDPFQTHAARHTHLQQHWGFSCACTLCTASEDTIQQSDRRIDMIRALWSELDDRSPASAANPIKAEQLLALYREEGLVTRMVEAYYRAAVEWNGIGAAAKGRLMAERAVAAGEVMEAGIRAFLGDMRALAANPEGHWSYRFRAVARGG